VKLVINYLTKIKKNFGLNGKGNGKLKRTMNGGGFTDMNIVPDKAVRTASGRANFSWRNNYATRTDATHVIRSTETW